MSQLNVDIITNKAGSGAPLFPNGITVTGALTGTATTATLATNAQNLTGSPSITVSSVNNTGLSTAVEFDVLNSTNSLTSGGLTVGIATLTTLNGTSGIVSVGSTFRTRGFVETQSSASVASNILNLDASQGTVFTHTTSAQIGIVSFTGIRTDSAGTQTFSVLVTQGVTPVNTTGATGIGTVLATVRITPGNVGYSTHIKVGGGTSMTLTNSAGALDLLTFIVSYNGATSIANTSFTVVGFAATDFRNAIV